MTRRLRRLVVVGAILAVLAPATALIVDALAYRAANGEAMIARIAGGPLPAVEVRDRSQRVLYRGHLQPGRHEPVSLDAVSPRFVELLLFSEDREFYDHPGIHLRGLVRAVFRTVFSLGGRQGGSTITQQMVKLLLGLPERTFVQKVRESILALDLDRLRSKDEILEAYVNWVYFPGPNYGVAAAADGYFGVSPMELSLEQAAYLVAAIPRPGLAAENPDVIWAYADALLARFEEANGRDRVSGSVRSPAAASPRGSLRSPGSVSREADPVPVAEAPVSGLGVDGLPSISPVGSRSYAVDLALRQAGRLAAPEQNGMVVLDTTIDAEIQAVAERAVVDALGRALFANVESLNDPPLQAAVVVLDRTDAGLLAVVGGREYGAGDRYNRAVDTRRPVGSAFKPFLYAVAAEELGYTADTIVIDRRFAVFDPYRGWYGPENHYYGYKGPIPLREAVAKSVNSVALYTATELGLDRFHSGIERFFPSGPLSGDPPTYERSYAVALGAVEFSPLQLATAYRTLATGLSSPSYIVRRASSRDGSVIYRYAEEPQRVVDPPVVATVDRMLAEVFAFEGTGWRPADEALPIRLAGKSGSLEDNSWFVAYDDRRVFCVWVGFDRRAQAIPAGVRYRAESVFMEVYRSIFELLSPMG